MIMNKWLIVFLCFTLVVACKSKNNTVLKEGDILFQNLDCGDLCNAIEAVTDGVDGKDFSHCAIVVKQNDSLKVVEAIGGAVQMNSLQQFFKRSGDTSLIKNITIARVKDSFTSLLPTAINEAKNFVNTPYDDEFIMNNGKLYCSELLFEAFKKANNNKDFFSLQPMTFKDPQTNEYFKAWVDYYEGLQKPIPQNKLGLNPGSISRSNKLQMIKINSFIDLE